MTAAEQDQSNLEHMDRMRFNAIMALFEDLPGGGRACMLEPFLGMLDLQSSRLERALAEGDIAQIREAAHTLKGGSLELGFSSLGERSAALEMAAREARRPEAWEYASFIQEVAWVRRFIALE